MPPRLHCPQLGETGRITLMGGEAHHARDVLRLAMCNPVELFDGTGTVAEAAVVELRRHELICEIASLRREPEPRPRITLATAVPKGERFDWLVEKATELGVSRLVPLETERSTVDPRASKLARLRHTVIAACKQSRRSWLMELADVTSWPQFVQSAGASLVVADPTGEPLQEVAISAANDLAFAIGPEGGFTAQELSLAVSTGGRCISLGRNLLRIETAAVAVAAWMALGSKIKDEGSRIRDQG
jgi:16S rRNA (uracil1498-N3)-methyltransferase